MGRYAMADPGAVFRAIDANGDGQLDVDELSEALGKLKVPCDLDFVAAAGHSDTEPGLVSSMVTHSDGIRDLLAK